MHRSRSLAGLVRLLLRTTVLWALAMLAAPALAAYNQSLTRTLDAGQIYGKVAANNTHAFLGIPFAQPPVGALRWRAPQPPQP
ncbi:carboxylesterase family protein, partial [Variovorax boronicumulans]